MTPTKGLACFDKCCFTTTGIQPTRVPDTSLMPTVDTVEFPDERDFILQRDGPLLPAEPVQSDGEAELDFLRRRGDVWKDLFVEEMYRTPTMRETGVFAMPFDEDHNADNETTKKTVSIWATSA